MTISGAISPEAAAYIEQARRHADKPGDPRLSVLVIPLYEKALAIEPDCADIYLGLAKAYRALGHNHEVVACCQQARALAPESIAARFRACMLQIPTFYDKQADILGSRQAYREQLTEMLSIVRQADPATLLEGVDAVGEAKPFHLPFQGRNDRRLQAMYGEIVSRIMGACHAQSAPGPDASLPSPHKSIRVGVVSGTFHTHSVWKVIVKGWLAQLDKARFQLIGYSLGGYADGETELARANCMKFVEGPRSIDEWRRLIRADRPHVLIYPEIGMKAQAVQLAGMRLAPIQCAAWGHSVTSGLPTIDYYLSGELVEPDGADDHYTEQLIRLPNLSFHYQPPTIAPEPLPRTEFGLRPTAVVYFCAQSLWKYLPQYDEILPRIAMSISDCQFAFLQHKKSAPVTKRFEHRLARAFAARGLNWREHIVLLPPLSDGAYHRLNQLADIFLDSIDYSGWTTTLESLNHDLPIVTMPGEFMRGRLGTAVLTWMGAPETIAGNLDEYVDIAVRLGVDAEWRRAVSQRIAVNKQIIYGDMECIRGMEHFLEQAVSNLLTQ